MVSIAGVSSSLLICIELFQKWLQESGLTQTSKTLVQVN
jgi:hypothetical protein